MADESTGGPSYPTALAHLVLTAVSLGALSYTGYRKHLGFPQAFFGVIATFGAVGVWRFGNPSYGDKAEGTYRVLKNIQQFLAPPCLFGTLILNYGYRLEFAIADLVVSAVPVFYDNQIVKDVATVINPLLILGISAYHQNYFGVAAAIAAFISEMQTKINLESTLKVPVPPIDAYCYCKCFFVFFAIKAILDSKI